MSTKTKRWLAFATTYEPNHKSDRWGSACIYFEYTDRDASSDDFEIDPMVAYHERFVAEAEAGSRILTPLFPDDQSYREVSEMMCQASSDLV